MTTLLEPLALRSGLRLRNRAALAPMTNQQSHEDGTLSDDELRWLARRARGGFGLVSTCAAHVQKAGQGWPGELGAFDDAHVPGLTRLAQAIRAEGAAAVVQIFHGGVRADRSVSGLDPWSASAFEGAREATVDDIHGVIRDFASAARRAEQAGFDGVEIHGAHGYLLTQFLSTTQNQRTDEWGGSLENRARLIRAVTRAVKAATKPTFTVGVRLSPEDFGSAVGVDVDEAVQVGRWLAEDGVDFVHASLWRGEQNTQKHPDRHAVTMFREALPPDVKLFAAGGVWTGKDAQALLDKGADVVAVGRAAIINPDWPRLQAEPGYAPQKPPVTRAQLAAVDVGPKLVAYMAKWKGFVSDA